jgi:hypothetical protein
MSLAKWKIKVVLAWYDLWIGAYYDRKTSALYILPVPMVGLKIWRAQPQIGSSAGLECYWGICADDQSQRCHAGPIYRSYFKGKPLEMVWCEEHAPEPITTGHTLGAL